MKSILRQFVAFLTRTDACPCSSERGHCYSGHKHGCAAKRNRKHALRFWVTLVLMLMALCLAGLRLASAQPIDPSKQVSAPVAPSQGDQQAAASSQQSTLVAEGSQAMPDPPSIESIERSVPASVPKGRYFKNKPLNEVFQVLAGKAGYSYFSNPHLDAQRATGHFLPGEELEQMKQLALLYDLRLYSKNETIYALNADQVKTLPRRQCVHKLRYLRFYSDAEEDKFLTTLKSALSDQGFARYDKQTASVILVDHEYQIEAARTVLAELDQPERQVIVQVTILRINNEAAKRFGIDWGPMLGQNGLSIGATIVGDISRVFQNVPIFGTGHSLAQVFSPERQAPSTQPVSPSGAQSTSEPNGFTPTNSGATVSGDGIILSPIQLQAVLRALYENNLAAQESSPRIVTKNNREAIFSVIDRIPIVTQTVTQSDGTNNISTDVRYRIDENDPTEEGKRREVGVTLTVTPSLMVGDSIELALRPQVSVVTGYVEASAGARGFVNRYPQVNESSATSIARVPNGYSLVLGGYYNKVDRKAVNKVPILGDIPFLNFAFKSKQSEKIRSDLLFVITPVAYDGSNRQETVGQSERLKRDGGMGPMNRLIEVEKLSQLDPNLDGAFKKRPKSKSEAMPVIRTEQAIDQEHMRDVLIRKAIPVSSQQLESDDATN